mmetsp:Transcript_140013/g.243863  ORF Transcript_140013/g.243863 Transcript_140013/m.243863 type:complete len:241 (-) Transcript_140013:537-1259(-)
MAAHHPRRSFHRYPFVQQTSSQACLFHSCRLCLSCLCQLCPEACRHLPPLSFLLRPYSCSWLCPYLWPWQTACQPYKRHFSSALPPLPPLHQLRLLLPPHRPTQLEVAWLSPCPFLLLYCLSPYPSHPLQARLGRPRHHHPPPPPQPPPHHHRPRQLQAPAGSCLFLLPFLCLWLSPLLLLASPPPHLPPRPPLPLLPRPQPLLQLRLLPPPLPPASEVVCSCLWSCLLPCLWHRPWLWP